MAQMVKNPPATEDPVSIPGLGRSPREGHGDPRGPDIPGSYALLLFTASDLGSITTHIHNWVSCLLWLHPFILSGVISPLISRSILGTYQPREFPFQYPIILPFCTVHGVFKARILRWFAIPFSSGTHSVRPLHHDPPILGCPTGMA